MSVKHKKQRAEQKSKLTPISKLLVLPENASISALVTAELLKRDPSNLSRTIAQTIVQRVVSAALQGDLEAAQYLFHLHEME